MATLAVVLAWQVAVPLGSGNATATGSPAAQTAIDSPVVVATPTVLPPTPPPTLPPPTPVPTPPTVLAPLTGLPISPEAALQRPIAVMVDDDVHARPQSGFSTASIVWHAPAEGGVPRYMMIFQDVIPAGVGPVRSARQYYVEWAAEWRALYVHHGGSPQALATLYAKGSGQWVFNADGFRWLGRYLWRTENRFAPHNVYTDGEHLRGVSKAVGAKDGPMEPAWRFAPDAPYIERPRDGRIVVKYSYNTIRYDYDRLRNVYLRTVSSEGAEEDAATGARVAPKNVVIMLMRFTPLNDGSHKARLGADVIGSGTAWIATNGKTIKGTWKKTKTTGPTRFFDAKGKRVTLTIGQTFIQVMPLGSSISIKDGKLPLEPTMPQPGSVAAPV